MSGQGAPRPAQPAQPAQAPKQADPPQVHLEQTAKDSRMQDHWLRWSALAERDRSYVVVFDKSSAAVTAEVKRIAGADAKTSTAPRVPGLYEDVEEGKDLGTVQVGLVSATAYASLKEKFGLQSITVKMGGSERTAFIPVARAARQGTASQAAPSTGQQEKGGSNAAGKGKA
ncbi:hypothetical protein C8A01DRAFT_17860 [Parachaetomium inaequale]|uniref:Uncharacterized protein n=1 Tax=Parachaetomium inaequale TaxID=2588326 RepID=A0AAN6PDK6_9PEZI|nr:hypothetical protein C8A01DRAFT_17860 [Parachaetomium inaequale]